MTKALRFGSLAIALTVVCGLAVATAPAGIAKRGDVRVAGKCTGPSTSKLKLSEEDGRIEVEFEVDQNRSGVRWTVVLDQSGARLTRLTRTTRPPSGSFEARVLAPNEAGRDVFTARGTRASGEVCTARAAFG
ncbi:MAG: hypothetical protein H0U00_13470 [Actinobacteria bacterium]|nr:hypothetical protein [Actinomycetota bacterium]